MFFTFQAYSQVCKKKDVAYVSGSATDFDPEHHILDIYYPKDTSTQKEVFIFIHGGSWRSGKKNTYGFLGKNMARKGVVTVIINYRLSPAVTYDKMAEDCARATDWVYQNISRYGGDPGKITLSGHSAGGHLAALIALDGTFERLNLKNNVSKSVLIDAFGLDMYSYFNEYKNDYAHSLYKVFGQDPEKWKLASPLYSVRPGSGIPFLVLAGSKTYPAILKSSARFTTTVVENGGKADYQIIPRKKHIGMISQLIFRRNKVYGILLDFIKKP